MGAEAMRQWGVGQKGKDNGAILFVFTGDRKMHIEAGYGLEGSLTDAKSKWITSTVIKPEFQRGDFDRGINNGVDAILATVRGEPYRGSGRTVAQAGPPVHVIPFWICPGTLLLLLGLVIYVFIASIKARKQGRSWGGVDAWSWSSSDSSSFSSSSSSSDSLSSSFDGGGGSGGGGGTSDSW